MASPATLILPSLMVLLVSFYGASHGFECMETFDVCSVNATCDNVTMTVETYNCTCDVGYIEASSSCEDVDECRSGVARCTANSVCTNTDGSYRCVCNRGYTAVGATCADINECALGTHNCSVNGICTNTNGTFRCRCRTGYRGNGYQCTDVNECREDELCSSTASCNNTQGSFTCQCNQGYRGDGFNCQDIDECELMLADCPPRSECVNTQGSFECVCWFNHAKVDGQCLLMAWIVALVVVVVLLSLCLLAALITLCCWCKNFRRGRWVPGVLCGDCCWPSRPPKVFHLGGPPPCPSPPGGDCQVSPYRPPCSGSPPFITRYQGHGLPHQMF